VEDYTGPENNIELTRDFNVVIDAGNGTAGFIAAPFLKEMGTACYGAFLRNGRPFPHHHPDPPVEKNLTA